MKIIRTKHFIALFMFIASNFTYAQKHPETNKNNPILKETQLSPTEKANVIIQSKGNFNTWKEQLDAAQSGGFEGILKKNNLTLKSYVLADKDFAIMPDAKFAVSNNDNTISILESNKSTKEMAYQEALKERTVNFFRTEDKDLRSVTLTWIKDGTTFNTNCIISQKFDCLVYDPILSHIFIFSK